MELPGPLRTHLDQGDYQAVEDAWLDEMSRRPCRADLFAATARSLAAAGEEERARFLLDMLDEHLRQSGAWEERLALLRQVGDLLVAPGEPVHPEIVATLEALHPDVPWLAPLAEKVGLHRAIDDLRKTWDKVSRLRDLLLFLPGTVVALEGKGAGRVTDLNLQLDVFKVELASGGAPVSVGFAAARKLLTPLPPGHLLRRKLEEPETLVAIKRNRPEELARLALESLGDTATAGELRQTLGGIVEDGEWTSFWNQVRKSPQLLAQPGGRQRYRWADSAEEAAASLLQRFAGAARGERLELLRTQADRSPELRRAMVAALREEGSRLAEGDQAAAFEVGLGLERAGESLAGEPFAPETLLRQTAEPSRFLAAVGDRAAREEAYRRLPALRDDWVPAFQQAMGREEDGRVLDLLADQLEQGGREALGRAIGELLNQPRKHPAGFAWLAERAARDEVVAGRAPLRLFQQIVKATGDEVFGPWRRRLAALADSGGTLPRLLPLLDQDQAALAEETVERAAGLETYQKEALRNAIQLRFPALHRAEEQPLYATPEAVDAKRDELRQLLEVEIPANRRAIEEARELGDLRENFEYKSARQRHEYLGARAASLHRDLGRARAIDPASVDPSAVRIGTRVRLKGPAGEPRELTLLGPWDSRPEAGILSHESELAQRLLGREVGDEVEVEGKSFRVEGIESYR
ncbi:MAG TPA: GreA/GreB family elongation factor [Thermoanaerobaculia bacterium]|nr:GreA/GreB family elongation factor [Thermoanaerobaculia bacterium]